MKSILLLLLSSTALSKIIVDLVGKVSPILTVMNVYLTIPPPGGETVTYKPFSEFTHILFSECELTFNSTNYNVPQKLAMKRTWFEPFGGRMVGSSKTESFKIGFMGPDPNYQFCHPQNRNITFVWFPESCAGKKVACWGDPHCYHIIDDSNRIASWDTWPIIAQKRTYHYILRNRENDWDIIYRTNPWGTATIADRLCVRNGEYVVCINNNPRDTVSYSSVSYYNPQASDTYPINLHYRDHEWQVMLPSGTIIEVVNYPGHLQFQAVVTRSDLGNLGGFGNATSVSLAISQGNTVAQNAFLAQHEVPTNIALLLESSNNTVSSFKLGNPNAVNPQFKFSYCDVPEKSTGIWKYKSQCEQDNKVKRDDSDSMEDLLFVQDAPPPGSIETISNTIQKRDILQDIIPKPLAIVRFAKAVEICEKYVNAVPCAQVMSPEPYIHSCVYDLQITGNLDFVQTSIKTFLHHCAFRAESTGTDVTVEKINGFGEFNCPSACSGRGSCDSHGCECDKASLGFNCAVLRSSIKLS